jgi:hypothetical protein
VTTSFKEKIQGLPKAIEMLKALREIRCHSKREIQQLTTYQEQDYQAKIFEGDKMVFKERERVAKLDLN